MSGFLQSTISTKKNDLCFLNIVLEKNKPTSNATSPLVNNSSVTPIQPSDIPKIILHIVEKTIALALHEINFISLQMKRINISCKHTNFNKKISLMLCQQEENF